MKVFKGSTPNTADIMKCLMEVSTKREWLERAVIACNKNGFIDFRSHLKSMTLGAISLPFPEETPTEFNMMGTQITLVITENLTDDQWIIS